MGPAYRSDGSDCPNPSWSNFNDWSLVLYGGNSLPGEYPDRPRKLNDYVSSVDLFRCPSNTFNWIAYDGWGTSYFYNSNWYGGGYSANPGTLGDSPWVLYGEPFDTFTDPARQIMVGDAATRAGLALSEKLRDGLPGLRLVSHCGGGSFKSQLRAADRSGARLAVILGDTEVEQRQVAIKPLRRDEAQTSCAWDELGVRVAAFLT